MKNHEALKCEYLSLYGQYLAARRWLPSADMKRMWTLEILLGV